VRTISRLILITLCDYVGSFNTILKTSIYFKVLKESNMFFNRWQDCIKFDMYCISLITPIKKPLLQSKNMKEDQSIFGINT